MLTVVVIGATGQTGQEVVKQSLAAGHKVIAVARRPEAINIRHPQLEIRGADVFDRGSLEKAFAGNVSVIVSAIGEAKISKPTTLYSEAATNVLAAMRKLQIRRFICIASSGYVDDPYQSILVRFLQTNVLQKVFQYVYEDTMRMEKEVRDSDLDWTIIRPPRLTNGRRTGKYRVHEGVVPGGAKLSRSDLADYIVNNLVAQRTYRGVFGVAY